MHSVAVTCRGGSTEQWLAAGRRVWEERPGFRFSSTSAHSSLQSILKIQRAWVSNSGCWHQVEAPRNGKGWQEAEPISPWIFAYLACPMQSAAHWEKIVFPQFVLPGNALRNPFRF